MSIRKIAAKLHRAPSTISRELKRNAGKRGYRHQQAQQTASERSREAGVCTETPVASDLLWSAFLSAERLSRGTPERVKLR